MSNGHETSQFGETMRKGARNPWVGGTALVALVTALNQGIPPVIAYFQERDQIANENLDAAHERTAEAYKIALDQANAAIARLQERRDVARSEYEACRGTLQQLVNQCTELEISASGGLPAPTAAALPDVGAGPPPTVWADEPELDALDDALEWLEATEE